MWIYVAISALWTVAVFFFAAAYGFRHGVAYGRLRLRAELHEETQRFLGELAEQGIVPDFGPDGSTPGVLDLSDRPPVH